MLRVLLADSHDLVRAGVKEILRIRPDLEVCAEADSAHDAVRLVATTFPDVIILGRLSSAKDAGQYLPVIAGASLTAGVLLISSEESPVAAHRAFELGAQGYLLLSDPGRELLNAVTSVAAHLRYVSPQVHDDGLPNRLAAGWLRGEASSHLTVRETEVLGLVAGGRRTIEIANMLHISKKTVETHRGAIMRKLQLHRLADVVRYAVQNNLYTATA